MKETLELWISRDNESLDDTTKLWLYRNKPIRSVGIFYDTGGHGIPLPEYMFPQLTWEDEPQRVKVTIETIDV